MAKNYADKDYYLVAGLVLSKLAQADQKLIDSCLNHSGYQADTKRIKAINTI
jgi:hypothetical protein